MSRPRQIASRAPIIIFAVCLLFVLVVVAAAGLGAYAVHVANEAGIQVIIP